MMGQNLYEGFDLGEYALSVIHSVVEEYSERLVAYLPDACMIKPSAFS